VQQQLHFNRRRHVYYRPDTPPHYSAQL